MSAEGGSDSVTSGTSMFVAVGPFNGSGFFNWPTYPGYDDVRGRMRAARDPAPRPRPEDEVFVDPTPRGRVVGPED